MSRPGRASATTWLDRGFTPREKARLGLEIVTAYGRVRRLVRRTDIRTAVEALRSAAPRARVGEPDARRAGVRLGQVVSQVLGPLPFDSRCLMRSLVLVDLLAARGVSATLVIAVTPSPEFRAHAWVEHGGVPLLEPADTPFERLVEI